MFFVIECGLYTAEKSSSKKVSKVSRRIMSPFLILEFEHFNHLSQLVLNTSWNFISQKSVFTVFAFLMEILEIVLVKPGLH